ncbi:MAG: cysteine desulfurase [Pirellulaceae bacterium]|nr:MAG: cysteine desulfurase [Pirellulaceae bacterium]
MDADTTCPPPEFSPASIGEHLRRHMPVTARWAYFDHAAVSPLPSLTRTAMQQYVDEAAEVGDVAWPAWAQKLASARHLSGQLVGAHVEEIALIPNTTYGINIVAEAFPWREGENVVVPNNEFPSNLLPWRNLQRRGVEVRQVVVPQDGRIDADLLRPAIDAKTRLVSLSWVGFASGFRVDLATIAELVHEVPGRYLMVDAIQGLGPFRMHVHQLGIDFLAADGHKWMLGPEGAGMLFIRRQLLDHLRPIGLGWHSLAASSFDPQQTQLKTDASRFEGGSHPMATMIGWEASLRLLLQCRAQAADSPLSRRVLDLVDLLADRLTSVGFRVDLPPEAHRSGIVPIDWPGTNGAVLSLARKALLANDIVTSVRGGRLRISVHAYNNSEDIARLVETLVDFRQRHHAT